MNVIDVQVEGSSADIWRQYWFFSLHLHHENDTDNKCYKSQF